MTSGRLSKPLVAALILLVFLAAVDALENFPAQTYAFSSPGAVGFTPSLNSTTIAQNKTLMVTLSDTNYLPFPNEPPGYTVFLTDNISVAPCSFSYPFGANAYQGRYVQANISAAKKLEVFNEFGFYSCPAIIGTSRLGPFQSVTRQVDISGYWTNGEIQQPGGGYSTGILHPFSPGTYTLLVADAWGHTELLYFQVT